MTLIIDEISISNPTLPAKPKKVGFSLTSTIPSLASKLAQAPEENIPQKRF